MSYFDVFRDSLGNYRWRLVASNGEKVATSGEYFASHANALRAANRVKEIAYSAIVIG